jgi:carboxypeptidase Taq
MLSPAEELGLAGAALDARVRRAVSHIPDSEMVHAARRLAADALANQIVYERDGAVEPVRIMLRPLLVTPEQTAYLQNTCGRIVDALKRLPQIWLADPEVRAILPLSPAEEAWLRECTPAFEASPNAIYGRLDAVCDFTGARWQDSLQFLEPNLSGVGGIQMGPLADSLVMRDVVPTILAHDPGLTIEAPRDQRDLFLQVLLDHARALGRRGTTICLVEPKYVAEGPNEQSALAAWLAARHGVTVVHADPTELRLDGDEVWYGDTSIDVAYRDYELRDLIELEQETGRPLAAMRALFRQNRVVSSAGGDFDHKGCWELLTDERLAARHFTSQERLLFRRHILWTRVVSARSTSLPRGHGDLPTYIREFREELVLKPNRGYGGAGVHLGALTPPDEWEALLTAALASSEDPDGQWVVQAVANLPVHEFPVVDDGGRVHYEPYYAVLGFTPTDHGLAMLCRVSQKQVVNVAQRGGLAALLVGYQPADLRAPVRQAIPAAQVRAKLRERIRQLRDLDAVIGLLDWDEETYLPAGGRSQRGQQLATVETLRHELLVDDALGDLIGEAAALAAGDALATAELDELRRERRTELALPRDLVGALAEARSRSLAAWETARTTADWDAFAAPFAELLRLSRERAQALQRGGDLYDGLVDEYEPGMTRTRLDGVLGPLGTRLRELVPGLAERTRDHRLPLSGPFPTGGQQRFCAVIARAMGFAFDRGRIDRSTHPFTMMAGENDVRFTLRYDPSTPVPAIFAALHEGGHALYDQGYPPALHDTLLATAPGMGIHESQSRLWENHVGRHPAFWQHFFPRLARAFPRQLAGVDGPRFAAAMNVVEPTLVRVDADAVTYNLHILLRYELELALLAGDLPVADLPVAWNEATRRWLGIQPRGLLDGVLQDVHWALGSFGYFPTYTLGNLYAAALAGSYERDHDLAGELAAGELAPLRRWLAEHVYAWGARLPAEEIIRRVTGEGLTPEPFFRSLARRYD